MGESVLQIERRKERRFPLRHSAEIKVGLENSREVSGVTENVSGHGVMLQVDAVIPEGTPVEIVLTPRLEPEGKPTRLVYKGKVLRSGKVSPGKFAIAAECERCVSIRVENGHPPPATT
jgi:PilZ domain-containing protein